MPRTKILYSAILLVMLVGPRTAMAVETKGAKPAEAAPAGEAVAECQKKVSNKGRPHRISSVANLEAIRAWSQKAMKYGEQYSMWHNAKSATIKCEKLPRSDYFVCFASGKPCPASKSGKTASNKTQ